MIFRKKKKEEEEKLKKEEKKFKKEEEKLKVELLKKEEELSEKEANLTKNLKMEASEEQDSSGMLSKFSLGLKKTKNLLINSIVGSVDDVVDAETLELVEENLLAADVGTITTMKIIEHLEQQLDEGKIETKTELLAAVKSVIVNIMDSHENTIEAPQDGPIVYIFVGVNGVGKTTTVGKIAAKLKREGKKVLVAAGDTFRAAAIEQVVAWCERAGVDYVANEIDSDPAATIHEAATKAKQGNYDYLLCDTSGRLHTKKNLMDELHKINRVLAKLIPGAPHTSILVIDATTGQNAITQTKEFNKLIGLNGLILTKLDGTAKGGVLIGIVNEFDIPVLKVGIGEGIDDLQDFSAEQYVESIFEGVV